MKRSTSWKPDSIILKEFRDIVGQIETDLLDEMMRLTVNHVPSLDEYAELIDGEPLYDDTDIEQLLGEAGCPICRIPDGTLTFGECSDPCTGAGCNIPKRSCERNGGVTIGSFHTHPLGGTSPSIQDINHSVENNEEIMCIGGLVGDRYMVTCYTPRAHVRTNGLIYNIFKGYYPEPGEEPEGIVKFFREEPAPTADDLNEILGDAEIRNIISRWGDDRTEEEIDEAVAEFRESLENGIIPDEYYDNDFGITEGEMDSLPVYSPDQVERIDTANRRHVSKDLFVYDFVKN